MTSAAVFAAQFLYIALKGWQTIQIVNGQKMRAAGCSLLLGLGGLFVMGSIALTVVRDGSAGLPVYLAYLAAGPCGIVCSMIFGHKKETPKKPWNNSFAEYLE